MRCFIKGEDRREMKHKVQRETLLTVYMEVVKKNLSVTMISGCVSRLPNLDFQEMEPLETSHSVDLLDDS